MIIFEKVRFKNINSVGNYFVEIPLNEYRNLVFCGKNGSGKSSILQAITFGAFGKPFTSIKIGTLVNSINKKGLVVELYFSKGEKLYKVLRGLKPDIFEIYENDVLLKQDAKKNDYQKTLDTIFGFDFKTFINVIILGASNNVPFMQLPAKERRDLIEKLLDLEVFSVMNDYTKKELKDINEQIKENDSSIYKVELNIEFKEKYKKEAEKALKDKITEHLKSIKEIQDKVDVLTTERNSVIETLSNIDVKMYEDSLKEFQEEHKKMYDDEIMIEAGNTISRKTLKFLDEYDVCPTCNQLLDEIYKQQIYDNTIIVGAEGIKAGKEEIKIKINKTKVYLGKIQNRREYIDALAGDIAIHNKDIKFYNNEIEKLNKTNIDNCDEALEGFYKSLKTSQSEKDSLREKKTIIDVALMLLKDDGIKASIIKKYVGLINTLINSYLEKFDFFVKFELNEQFEETFKSRYVDSFSYLNFSEGEKKRIDLAILFVLKEISKRKNMVSCNLIAFDETIERIDEPAADCFAKILRSTDTNNIIISHDDKIISKFTSSDDCVMNVFKKGKFSYYKKN